MRSQGEVVVDERPANQYNVDNPEIRDGIIEEQSSPRKKKTT